MSKRLVSFYTKHKGVSDSATEINKIWEKAIRTASKQIRKLYKIEAIKEERQEVLSDIHERGYKAYDLHVHSFISNGEESPQAIIDYAVEIGLDGIAITDQNAIRGAKQAQKYIEEKGYDLMLFPGEEIICKEGHMVAYWDKFPDKIIKDGQSVKKNYRKIHEMGGIVVAAHPFGQHGVTDTNLLLNFFDALEISSRSTAGPDSLTKDFAELHGIPYTGSSTAHLLQSIGSGCTITKGNVEEPQDLYDLILNHQSDVFITPMWVEMLTYLEEEAEDKEGLMEGHIPFYTKYQDVSDRATKINRIWEKQTRKAGKKIRKLYLLPAIKEERQEDIQKIHNQGYKAYDLHTHTYISDGLESVESVIDWAVDIGLDGIAITDHNAIRGAIKAQKYIEEKEYEIMLVPGEEISAKGDKHIAAYWNEFPEIRVKASQSVKDTCKEIHKDGGLAVAAHMRGRHAIADINILLKHFDALEINGRSTSGEDSMARDIAEMYGIPCTGGSDAHLLQSIGCGFTITKRKVKEPQDLFDLIVNFETDVFVKPVWVEILTYLEELSEDYEEGLIHE
jgi:predicted metal-dependent phosphoesterase TrpH